MVTVQTLTNLLPRAEGKSSGLALWNFGAYVMAISEKIHFSNYFAFKITKEAL